MKKLFIAGASLALMAGMGITAAAAGRNIFLAATVKPEVAWQHHTSHWQRHSGGCDFSGFCNLYGVHHGETNVSGWADEQAGGSGDYYTGTQAGSVGYCYTGNGCNAAGTGNCYLADGYCMNWADEDGDGICDLCTNPVCYENGVTGAGNGNAQPQNPGSGQPQGNGAGAQGSGDISQQADTEGVPAGTGTAGDTATGNQNYGGYGTGCYNSNYGGCGNRTGHHRNGHHR